MLRKFFPLPIRSLLVSGLLLIPPGRSQVIEAVENEHALIHLQGAPVDEGDLVIVNDPTGKHVGVVRIQKVIPPQALGRITRGHMAAGLPLQLYDKAAGVAAQRRGQPRQDLLTAYDPEKAKTRPASPADSPETRQPSAEKALPLPESETEISDADADQLEEGDMATSGSEGSGGQSTTQAEDTGFSTYLQQLKWGVMGGYNVYQQTVVVGTARENVNLNGGAFSFGLFADWKLHPMVAFRHTAGIDQFFVTGTSTTASCTGGSACQTTILYASVGSWLRVRYPDRQIAPWIGLGGNLMAPVQKTSSALEPGSITPLLLGLVGVGADWQVSENTMVPLQLDYSFWPTFTGVTTSAFTFRAGVTF